MPVRRSLRTPLSDDPPTLLLYSASRDPGRMLGVHRGSRSSLFEFMDLIPFGLGPF